MEGDEAGEGNAVSQLQEYIQGCSTFSPHTKILTWTFQQQLDSDTSLQFRAFVSFVFFNVPHHFSGGWQTSKKKAQRDTAERVKLYLEHRSDTQQKPQQKLGEPVVLDGDSGARAAIDPANLPVEVLQELEAACQGTTSSQCALDWAIQAGEEDVHESLCKATLSFHICSVPHHFVGSWCKSDEDARRDAAERVLWYFGRSNEEFKAAELSQPGDIPQVPASPAPGSATLAPRRIVQVVDTAPAQDEAQQAAEDKTILMQVQNALQKKFASETPPGQRVWVWTYEADHADPQLFRAHVEVPSWGHKTFVGDWCRGKKLAQRNACFIVKQTLDMELLPR